MWKDCQQDNSPIETNDTEINHFSHCMGSTNEQN